MKADSIRRLYTSDRTKAKKLVNELKNVHKSNMDAIKAGELKEIDDLVAQAVEMDERLNTDLKSGFLKYRENLEKHRQTLDVVVESDVALLRKISDDIDSVDGILRLIDTGQGPFNSLKELELKLGGSSPTREHYIALGLIKEGDALATPASSS